MSYTQSDDGPPCPSSSRGADPKLTYFAVRPDHSASATIHFKGTWFTGPSFVDPDTGQCGEVRTTSDFRPWDMHVTWTPIPDSEFVTVCFSPPWDCSPGGFFPADVIVRKREVRRWWG